MKTQSDAIEFVTKAINGETDGFDVKEIVSELRDSTGTWDMDQIDSSFFWDVVVKHTI